MDGIALLAANLLFVGVIAGTVALFIAAFR